MNADLIEKREMQVCQGGRFGVLDVTVAFHARLRTTSDDYGQIRMVVDVRVTDTAAVKVKRMIEQGAVAFFRVHQLADKLGEERYVELIDFCHAGDFVRVVAVMGKRMMRIRHADLRVSAVAGFASQLERDDARDVALQREDLQVEHEPSMIAISSGDADRTI